MFSKIMHIRKIGLVLLVICFFTLLDGYASGGPDEKKKEEDPKKKELKDLMKKMDGWYKKSEERMGYYLLTDSDWEVFIKTGETVTNLADIMLKKFVPPDDKVYLKETKDMKKHAEDIVKSANERYVGAYEDIQYSFGRLRNTCKNCHNHLGIQIYTSLYPGEAPKEGKEGQ
ncbi:MAG TPA: hypothetical protein ACFYD3_06315 [Candidatus Hypogeohydataceae bacterium YC41]